MTEAEAKKKWCPMARPATFGGKLVANRETLNGQPTTGSNCIGSECMMWRDTHKSIDAQYGYCGLGGKP